MARYTFGGGAADWVGRVAGDLTVQAAADTVCTFWDAQTGGNQVTDLLVGGQPASSVTTDSQGVLPTFQGPDGVTRLWVDAGGVERVLLTTSDEGVRYVRITSSTSWTPPAGVTRVVVRVIGAGGGGGGGGSAATSGGVTGQAGGSGGGCGQEIIQIVDVSTSPTVTCTIGAGGNGGTGGAVGGNAGTVGTVGGDTYFGSIRARGGGCGAGSNANSTNFNIPVGLPGTAGTDYPWSSSTVPPYNTPPGYGGKGGYSQTGVIPLGTLVGGSAGAQASATNGGGPGDVTLTWPAVGGVVRGGSQGDQPGADGGDAPKSAAPGTRAAYGCGGAGGGGGAPGGRGGNGSPGGNGFIEIWW